MEPVKSGFFTGHLQSCFLRALLNTTKNALVPV